MSTSILITGGNGNLAKIIHKHLSTEFNIICITRKDFDLLNLQELTNYLNNNKFDVLIHTAISGGRRTKEENGDVVYENLLMFEILMKFSNKFKLIINFDSGAIYDRSTDIYCKKESEELNVPRDYYGFSKYLIYKRSLQYDNIVNFRIFNIFHVNEEPDRFIKSCFLAKKNGTNVSIFQDKYFDFMYEDDFIKVIKYYLDYYSENLPKTFNLSYTNKYKLSDIANMILNKDQIKIMDSSCSNYCGDGTIINSFNIKLDGLEDSLKKYAEQFL
jgi:dTDP-4-dehydrorhamnose reductase